MGIEAPIFEICFSFSERTIVVGSALYYGPVAHYLGLLAATRSHWDAAIAYFEAAIASEQRAGARVFARPHAAGLRTRPARAQRGRGPRAQREARTGGDGSRGKEAARRAITRGDGPLRSPLRPGP